MNHEEPFFSLIIPTYNRADRISKTLESVLRQTYNNFEVIVVDDGSTDNTKEVVEQIADKRVRYVYKVNGERGAARNYGIRLARGKYVTFLDSDDVLLPYHFETVYEELKASNFPALYHQPFAEIYEDGKIISKTNVPRTKDIKKFFFTQGNFFGSVGIFIQKELALQYLFDEERLLAGSEDHEFMFRLLLDHEIVIGTLPTTHVIHHKGRSEFNINKEKVKQRFLYLHNKVINHTTFKEKYPQYIKRISFSILSLLALYLAVGRFKKEAIKFFLRSLTHYPRGLFSLRTLVIIKKVLFD